MGAAAGFSWGDNEEVWEKAGGFGKTAFGESVVDLGWLRK